MSDKLDMQEITRRIVQTVHPRRVILFGSRARGQGRADSDWDILVIADSDLPRFRRAAPSTRRCVTCPSAWTSWSIPRTKSKTGGMSPRRL